jgi:DNA-binding MurR/RpiR family transcriptional regulator
MGAYTGSELLRERLRAHGRSLSRVERTIAEYLADVELDELPFLRANQIAAATGTSDASVTRAARSLGFTGLPELKRIASRPRRIETSRSERLDTQVNVVGDEAGAIAEAFHDAMRDLLEDNAQLVEADQLERAAAVIRDAGTVWAVGVGTSGAAALHLADRLARAGHPSRWTRAAGFDLAAELLSIRPGDALVVFHAARPMPELTTLLDWAQRADVPVVLVCGTQLAAQHGSRVSAVLPCVGTASELARWTIAAVQLAELLTAVVAASDPARSAAAHQRLDELRHVLTGSEES